MKENKLIAEFMEKYWYNPEWSDKANAEQWKYHTSWDWLIPVLKKIGNIISKLENSDLESAEKIFEDINYWIMSDDIKSVYNAVIKFIIWTKKMKNINIIV